MEIIANSIIQRVVDLEDLVHLRSQDLHQLIQEVEQEDPDSLFKRDFANLDLVATDNLIAPFYMIQAKQDQV